MNDKKIRDKQNSFIWDLNGHYELKVVQNVELFISHFPLFSTLFVSK